MNTHHPPTPLSPPEFVRDDDVPQVEPGGAFPIRTLRSLARRRANGPEHVANRPATFRVPTVKARLAASALSFFLLCVSRFAGAQDALVDDTYLDALAMIESGSDHAAQGKAGERGAWQIKAVAWQYTSELRQRRNLAVHPFSAAANATVARAYTRTLVEDHRTRFTNEYARTPTPGELYAIWNLGFAGFQRRGSLARCPALTKDAARRLTNLLRHLSPNRMVPDQGLSAASPR